MRIPEENENLVGTVCVCSVGRLFVVTGRTCINLDNDVASISHKSLEGWCGLGLDGKGTAFSSQPCVIAESGQEFHDKLLARFGHRREVI